MSTETALAPFFRDLATGAPCPRRGSLLCTIADRDHLHRAIHMDSDPTARPALPADVTALTDDMSARGYTIGRPISSWAVCWCTDGQHAGNTVLMRADAYNEQAARQLAAHQKARGLSGHAIETVTVTASFTRGAL